MSNNPDCKKSIKRSSKITWLVGIGFLVITSLIVSGLFVTPSAILIINYDSSQWGINPTQPIRISSDYYADVSNATFTPICILIGYLYQRTESVLGQERYIGQIIKQNIVSDSINVNLDVFKDASDWFSGYSTQIIDQDSSGSIQMRLPSDYELLVEISIMVRFNDPTIKTTNLKFLYIQDAGVLDGVGLPEGQVALNLQRGYTLQLDIHNIDYNYTLSNAFWNTWVSETQVTPYPFLINASVSNTFNLANYINIHS